MTKKKRKAAREEEPFFVGVQDPIELRRSVLESSKDLLHYLSRFEKFKHVRNEKSKQIAKLKDVTAEITKMVNKLKAALPKTKLRAQLHKHEKKVKKRIKIMKGIQKTLSAPPKKAEARKPRAAPTTDLERLEAELGEIESRLTKIS